MAKLTKKQIRQQEEALKALLLLIAGASYLFTQSVPATVTMVLIVVVLIIVFTIFKAIKQREKLRKSGIDVIDLMDGVQFEYYLKELFMSQGYKVEVTKASGDYGADLVLKKNHEKIVVQAKRYSKNVGIKAVQEISGAKTYYLAQAGWVVTNSYFTKAAKELASSLNVKLIDRDELIESIVKMNPDAIPNPKNTMKVHAISIPCPKCGSQMTLRKSNHGHFYGCSSFPKCKYTKSVI